MKGDVSQYQSQEGDRGFRFKSDGVRLKTSVAQKKTVESRTDAPESEWYCKRGDSRKRIAEEVVVAEQGRVGRMGVRTVNLCIDHPALVSLSHLVGYRFDTITCSSSSQGSFPEVGMSEMVIDGLYSSS